MNLNELSKRAHQNAVSHGFWDGQKTTREHCLMLIVTEISEMVEADRHDKHADLALFDYAIKDGEFNDAFKLHVKDSVEDECADIAIRLLDMSGAMGIDFTHVKTPDYYRDFGRFSMTENAFALVKGLAKENISIHVYSGNEVYADADSLDALLNGSALTLAESQYVLVELSSLLSTQVVLQIVLQMRQNGFIPVLAHVERSFRCKNRLAFSRMLVENGALLQVDAHSLFYRFGLRTALFVRKLLRNHLVFVVETL